MDKKILCLMPTYGKTKETLQSSLKLFLEQTHSDKFLIIFDDQGRCKSTVQDNYAIVSQNVRQDSLPAKYKTMVDYFAEFYYPEWEAIALWDDDDVYLPWHLANHNENLQTKQFSYFSHVLSTYSGGLTIESSVGMFHGSIAYSRNLYEEVGGYSQNCRGDFDQDMMQRLLKKYLDAPYRPDQLSYIYQWGRETPLHCSSYIKDNEDETWYNVYADNCHVYPIGELVPEYDKDTKITLEQFKTKYPKSELA